MIILADANTLLRKTFSGGTLSRSIPIRNGTTMSLFKNRHNSWAFAGTSLSAGASFGRYGIEIDARTTASPPGTQLLASIPDVLGPGRNAEMTYYETPAGAKVFAAGALNFAASLGDPVVARIMDNLWTRLSAP